MDSVLAGTYQTAVLDRLRYLDQLATRADRRSLALLAETEFVRMTRAWQDLLRAHQPDEDGNCRECSGRRRPRRFPCSVWIVAHRSLVSTR